MLEFCFCSNLDNKWMKYDKFLYMHWYWQNLGDFLADLAAELWTVIDVDCNCFVHLAFLQHKKHCSRAIVRLLDSSSLYQSYGPWLMSAFCVHPISLEKINRISPNFVYTWSRSGLSFVIMALDWGQEFRFRSIFWEQIDRISLNFLYAFIMTRSRFRLLNVFFLKFVTN